MITNYKINQPFTSNLEEAWREDRKIPLALENMESAELSTMLKRRSKSVEGQPYSRNPKKANSFRQDRFLSGSLKIKPFTIIPDKVFKPANEALDRSL